MTVFNSTSQAKLAVLCLNDKTLEAAQKLAKKLQIPCYQTVDGDKDIDFFLHYRADDLVLLDKKLSVKQGLKVNIEPRAGEQHSYPAPRKNDLAKAIGKHSKTVIDATTGWGQDSLALFRMGYEIHCFERSPIMAVLLENGFARLQLLNWVQNHQLRAPLLTHGNAIELFSQCHTVPDCIYLDPMFAPKRKKSALAKKSIQALQQLLGQDDDKKTLFDSAMVVGAKRVVVKSPLYAEPLGGQPDTQFKGKLVRYDVYFKS